MKLTKLDENGKWWVGLPTTWVYSDKKGDWWLIKDDGKRGEKKPKMKTKSSRSGCASSSFGAKQFLFVFLCSFLGVVLGVIVARILNLI